MVFGQMDSKILENSRKILADDNTIVFELINGDIIKIFNRAGLTKQYGSAGCFYLMKIKEAKLKLADNFTDFKELVTPKAMLYDEYGFVSYTMRKVTDETFGAYYRRSSENQSLDILAKRYYELEKVIRRGNDLGLVFPDGFSDNNIRYNPKTGRNTLIDYDGIQVNNIFTGEICDTIHSNDNPILNEKKYFNDLAFNRNLDKFSLTIDFFLYATSLNMAAPEFPKDRNGMLYMLGFMGMDDPAVICKLLKLYDRTQDNDYFGEDLLRIQSKYYLAPNPVDSRFGKFMRRR